MYDDELPRDPDLDDVPPELLALDGRKVGIVAWDGEADEIVRGEAIVVVVPGLHGDARRSREVVDGDA
jgi:hypothetical protein